MRRRERKERNREGERMEIQRRGGARELRVKRERESSRGLKERIMHDKKGAGHVMFKTILTDNNKT